MLFVMTSIDCSLARSFEALHVTPTLNNYASLDELLLHLQSLAGASLERVVEEIFLFAEALFCHNIPLKRYEGKSSLEVAYLFAEKISELVDSQQFGKVFQRLAFQTDVGPLKRLWGVALVTVVGFCESKRSETVDTQIKEITAPLEAFLECGLNNQPLDALLYHPTTLAVLMQMYRGEEAIAMMDVLHLLEGLEKGIESSVVAFIDFLATMKWDWASTKDEAERLIQIVQRLETFYKKQPGYYLQKLVIPAIEGICYRVQLLKHLSRNGPTCEETLLLAISEKNDLLQSANYLRETLGVKNSAKVTHEMQFLSTMALSALTQEKHLLTVDGVVYVETAENLRLLRPRLRLTTAAQERLNHTSEYRSAPWEKAGQAAVAKQTTAS